ncbi:TetR/AcrR family transcriptional regulator [Rossellomorea marisflavi]|uniref:TetR family transcriptional regulator n=1 Tax=Rossellomorea marisflavi TaxID=189381 RepID=A0A0J5WAH7_9BACI|nr:TetR/AcrR family transcriptional regulator [Rossellomorea marisflavi]KMK96856.1 TetR family transcriptional regulator [Rossellomorea marisflavi]KML06100.1 TetR family transcriptional regulator [Rossellomorea marisflavi]KML33156.1 TetR family transcriptional regulator [Rossellomorea marisflavi]KZE47670.1 TetR family transcriptional regulator [Rossellomorea marisflavi]MCM2603871.1 TetR/AcrR family transcriptional regulator [Rossellomorea marisflavi]
MEVKTIDRKKQIVDAATKSFSLFGYKATTMDQVAKLANVGKGTIYTFFSNKEELFDEIAFSLMDEMKGRAEKAISPTVTFSENVHNALFSMLEYRKEHKLTIKLYQEAREMGTPAVSDALQKLEQMVVEFLSERISRAIESKAIKPCNPEMTAFVMLKLYVALIFDWERERGELDKDEIANLFKLYLIEGLSI